MFASSPLFVSAELKRKRRARTARTDTNTMKSEKKTYEGYGGYGKRALCILIYRAAHILTGKTIGDGEVLTYE